jgi:1-acyl-sn-glycerol-3-phosphate acyltransferase
MRRVVDWLITPVYLCLFFGILLVFQPFLFIASRINHRLFRHILHLMCYAIVLNLKITAGTRFKITRHGIIPKDAPLIVISNHQSMYDIPLLMWELREHAPLFISKRELARWIPSISLALRNMGTAIIDRKDPAQAIEAITKLGERGNTEHCAIFIFPEGTRARKGELKPFKARGFLTLCEKMPDAYVIPVAINNAWKVLEHNLLPIPWGITVTTTIHEPMALKGNEPAELLQKVRGIIQENITS